MSSEIHRYLTIYFCLRQKSQAARVYGLPAPLHLRRGKPQVVLAGPGGQCGKGIKKESIV